MTPNPLVPELDRAAAAIEAIDVTDSVLDEDSGTVEFAMELGESAAEVLERIRRGVLEIDEAVSNYVVVRTDPAAVTFVGWTGGIDSCWVAAAPAEAWETHWQSLREAIEVRARLMRILSAALKVAAAVSAAMALSTSVFGALLAARKLANALDDVVRMTGAIVSARRG
jgi:hypothetical protein